MNKVDAEHNKIKCRLCDEHTIHRFNKQILGKFDVKYFECLSCGSLQTEVPYWLNEAYGKSNLSDLDTGAVQRNLHNLAACWVIVKLYNLKNVIDIGGGDGLLCRLLRDREINCYVKDKYSMPTYSQGFTEQNFENPDLIISFEVLEHLQSPKVDLDDLFSTKPKLLLVTTDIWQKQTDDWWYFMPESGQHVFFYSEKALTYIAHKYDYKLLICNGYILFIKKISPIKNLIAKLILRGKIIKLMSGFVAALPTRGIWKDHLLQKEKVRQGAQRQK